MHIAKLLQTWIDGLPRLNTLSGPMVAGGIQCYQWNIYINRWSLYAVLKVKIMKNQLLELFKWMNYYELFELVPWMTGPMDNSRWLNP